MLLGTFACPVVVCVVCAPPGIAAPCGLCCLALSVCVGCGWRPASLACLVAPRRCTAPRPVRLLPVRRSAFMSPWCLPLRGAYASGFPVRLRGARWSRPRTRLIVPAAAPHPATMALSLVGPFSADLGWRALRLFAVFALGHSYVQFSCTVRLATGSSARAPGLICVDANTSPFGCGEARVLCDGVCAGSSWPGRAGRPAGRVLVRLTFSFWPLSLLSFFFGRPLPGLVALFPPLFFHLLSAVFPPPFFPYLFRCFAPPVSLAFCGPALSVSGISNLS